MDAPHLGAPSGYGEAFLAGLADGVRAPVADGRHVAVVVAHPDDETIGCGAVLARLDGVTLVVVTDGAPRDLVDARRYGFGSALAYADARSRELATAARIALVRRDRIIELGIEDQGATERAAEMAAGIARLIVSRGIRIVLTHAFEGGHPDHDGVALAVHAAKRLAMQKDHHADIVEMPFYRSGEDGELVLQRFGPPATGDETVLHLDPGERWIKRQMTRAHRTQATTIAGFDLGTERFWPAPAYDFTCAPNGGRICYAGRGWGVPDFEAWRNLALAALSQLGFAGGGGACRRS